MKSVELAITIVAHCIKSGNFITQFTLYSLVYAINLVNLYKNKSILLDEPFKFTRLGIMQVDCYEAFNYKCGNNIFELPSGFWASYEPYRSFAGKETEIYYKTIEQLKNCNIYDDFNNLIKLTLSVEGTRLLRSFLTDYNSLYRKIIDKIPSDDFERKEIPLHLLILEAKRFNDEFFYEEYLI